MASIILVRHGRSSLRHDGSWMSATSVSEYERAYDAAGILDGDAPPDELREMARNATVLVASDMRRAIESAHRLVPGREPEIQPLLRELYLEPPRWLPTKLPIEVWDSISFFQWTIRLALGLDHALVQRGDKAAEWLAERAANGGTLLVITHGGLRRIVSNRLKSRGWRCSEQRRGYENWSAWSHTK
jgi:broad specificity phosphatase PhoE